jgi:hypothetical protein
MRVPNPIVIRRGRALSRCCERSSFAHVEADHREDAVLPPPMLIQHVHSPAICGQLVRVVLGNSVPVGSETKQMPGPRHGDVEVPELPPQNAFTAVDISTACS